MGATLSSPQLGDGLVLVAKPNTTGPFNSAFTVDASDTNSFGFSATMKDMGTVLQAQYTNTANTVKTATCSAQNYSYITYTDYYNDNGGHVTSTGYRTNADTTFASIFCPIANTQIGTGPMILSLSNRPDDPTWFPSPATYALYFGPTSVTASQDPITTTSLVPGQTTHLATVTSTVYGTTETVAVTTTLTGQHSASRCLALPISSPTTLSTSTRSSSSSFSSPEISSGASSFSSTATSTTRTSSARSSSQTHSASAPTSRGLSSKSSSKIISSSSKASTLPKTASSSKPSSSKVSISSRNTSKSASSKAILMSSSTKTSSKSTSTSKISVCSMGTALKSLSSYPSIASHLCQDVLSSKQSFPSSISVWPASQLSSACSCYAESSPTKISATAKPSLSKRLPPVVERPYVSSSTDSSFSNSSSVSSSSTTLVPTTFMGYGPPNIYSIPTITISTTVYVTGNRTVLPTTTTIVSIDTTTVTANSTVTIDRRTLPTTCITNTDATKVALSARSLTCDNLKLHTAFLWVMMKDPFDFCAYYLTANRNTSPLLEMSASTLKDTCSCLMTHKSALLPAFKIGPSYSPKPKRQCNQSVVSLIKAKFKEPKTFCKYYTSTSRSISPFSMLKPGDLFAGCSCLI